MLELVNTHETYHPIARNVHLVVKPIKFELPPTIDQDVLPLDTLDIYLSMMGINSPSDITIVAPCTPPTTTVKTCVLRLSTTRPSIDIDPYLPPSCDTCIIDSPHVITCTPKLQELISKARLLCITDQTILFVRQTTPVPSQCEVRCSRKHTKDVELIISTPRYILTDADEKELVMARDSVYSPHTPVRCAFRLRVFATDYHPSFRIPPTTHLVVHVRSTPPMKLRTTMVNDIIQASHDTDFLHIVLHSCEIGDIACLLTLINQYCAVSGRPPLLIGGVSPDIKACVQTCVGLVSRGVTERRMANISYGVLYSVGSPTWEIGISSIDTGWHTSHTPPCSTHHAHENTTQPVSVDLHSVDEPSY